MTDLQREKIRAFLNDQIAQADFRAKGYVFDEHNKKRPQRSMFLKMKKYVDNFLAGNIAIRWTTLTGLRGAGKTTLLFQSYYEKRTSDYYKLFLSVDQVVQLLGSSLYEVLEVYEELLGASFEMLDRPLLLFLDEVQYDPKWGVTLKNIYDRSHKVFIFATGSSALLVQTNTDIARRTIYEKLFPLNFCEYLKIRLEKFEYKGLCQAIRSCLFESANAAEVYHGLKKKEEEINSYLVGVTRIHFDQYLHFGSLPFMLTLQNESLVYDQISKIIDRIIRDDIANAGNLGSEIVSKIPRLLYAVAGMDVVNFSHLAGPLEMSRPKIAEIFELLQYTETLTRILPYGSHLNQVKKPSKYLFSSPSFRAMYYKTAGSILSAQDGRGKLLEDLVGMYITRFLYQKQNKYVAYDAMEGGADFIISFGDQKIVLEVSAGQKEYRQVIQTSKRVNANYSLIISDTSLLEYSSEFNAVKVPLRMFLLM